MPPRLSKRRWESEREGGEGKARARRERRLAARRHPEPNPEVQTQLAARPHTSAMARSLDQPASQRSTAQQASRRRRKKKCRRTIDHQAARLGFSISLSPSAALATSLKKKEKRWWWCSISTNRSLRLEPDPPIPARLPARRKAPIDLSCLPPSSREHRYCELTFASRNAGQSRAERAVETCEIRRVWPLAVSADWVRVSALHLLASTRILAVLLVAHAVALFYIQHATVSAITFCTG